MVEYNISEDQIKQTIESPDKINRLDMNYEERNLRGVYPSSKNLFVNFYLKKFNAKSEDLYMLIITKQPEGDSVHIVHGFKLTSNIVVNIDEVSPLDALRTFLDIFGCVMMVDGDERKFVTRAMLFPDGKGRIPLVHAKPPKDIRFSSIQFIKKTKNYAIIAYAMVINQTKYIEWLRTSKLI